jgi:flagellar basal body rod protein FlgB
LFNQHKKEFSAWLDSENQKIVGSKVNENNKLSKTNSESLKKIDELTKQIQSLNSSVDTNNVTIEQNNAVIEKETIVLENKKIKFENSFTFVVGKISDDIQKINTYLVNL